MRWYITRCSRIIIFMPRPSNSVALFKKDVVTARTSAELACELCPNADSTWSPSNNCNSEMIRMSRHFKFPGDRNADITLSRIFSI